MNDKNIARKKRFNKNSTNEPNDLSFVNFSNNEVLPEGYKSSTEFRLAVKKGLISKLQANGYIK
jgi:hypothetical protein